MTALTKLTKKQKIAFQESYLINEMDVVLNCMDDQQRLELFQTSCADRIRKKLIESIKDIETVECIRNGFNDVYDHIFEGVENDTVALCGYTKLYVFDRIKLEGFIRYHYSMMIDQFLCTYTYDDAEELASKSELLKKKY